MKKGLCLLLTLFLVGCSSSSNKIEVIDSYYTGIISKSNDYIPLLNTSVFLRVFNKKDKHLFDETSSLLKNVHIDVDAYNEYKDKTNLCTINNKLENEQIIVSDSLFTLLEDSIELTKLSEGKFNLAIGALIDYWKPYFDLGNIIVDEEISEETLTNIVSSLPTYSNIEEYIHLNKDNHSISINNINDDFPIKLNLGAISKGYAIDQIKDTLGNTPSIISCGESSIRFNNSYPEKKRSFRASLREPKLNTSIKNIYLSFDIPSDTNLSTSGISEKYYYAQQEDGSEILRSHIIDPSTGYSSTYHLQTCVYSQNTPAYALDALTTAIMNYKDIEDIKKLIARFENKFNSSINYVVVDSSNLNNYVAYANQGFVDSIDQSTISNSITSIEVI